MGSGLKVMGKGTKAAAKLKSRDWSRLFAELTDRVEQMSEVVSGVLQDQRERLPEVREKLGDAAEVVRDKAGGAAEVVREKAGDAAEALREKGKPLGQAVLETAGTVAEAARETAEKAKDKAPSFERKGGRKRRRLMGLIFNRFTLGFGAGYVLGAKAGRERYEQIVQLWNRVSSNPAARQATQRGKTLVSEAGSKLASRVQERRESTTLRDASAPAPSTIPGTDTISP